MPPVENREARVQEVFPRQLIGPLTFDVASLSGAITAIAGLNLKQSDSGVAVHFANAYNVALACRSPLYRELLNNGDLVFTDGVPIVWAVQLLNPKLRGNAQRVYGPDVMRGVLSVSDQSMKHYLLGGSEETVAELRRVIGIRWPNAEVVGAESPPYRALTPEELRSRDGRILSSGANLVWVGLGTPKQDFEVRRIADSLPVVVLAVGAAFDFIAGTSPQAPLWLQRRGLEWVFRWLHEPKRLTKRYLLGNPLFVMCVFAQILRDSVPRKLSSGQKEGR